MVKGYDQHIPLFRATRAYLGLSWVRLRFVFGMMWAVLSLSWAVMCVSWYILVPSWMNLGHLEAIEEPS